MMLAARMVRLRMFRRLAAQQALARASSSRGENGLVT
jgi:hypothetical protein